MSENKEVWYIGYMRKEPGGKKFFVEQKAEATTCIGAGKERDKLQEELGTGPDKDDFTYSDFGLRMKS